ncbi:sensor histidine kinase [Paenibacillus chartarius]|uniref:histidine kinase n=1 Tax=Paenibacillus chartarius TaxID=747481 RepID=A0ABV6DGY7_9BACL
MAVTTFSRMRKSIFAKFTFSFIAAGLIPLLLISYFSLNTFSSYVERNAVNNYEQMFLYAGKNLDDMNTKYNNISKIMYSYGVDGVYSQLGQAIAAQAGSGDVRLQSTIDDFLRTILYTDKHLTNVFFVTTDGRLQHLNKENKTFDIGYSYPEPGWAKKLDNERALVFFPTHPETYFLRSDQLVMTYARNLTDVLGSEGLNAKQVGTFYMDVSMSAFDEIFQQMVLNPKDYVYVMDNGGIVLYSNHRELIGKPYAPLHSDEHIQIEHTTEGTDWKVRGDFYKADMFKHIEQIKNTLFVVIAGCIVSLIMVAILFSNRLSGPIRSISQQMGKIESGNFNTQVTVRTTDEIGLLARSFNKMVVRLQSYIDEVYIAQIKQKQAELSALKSQIRPHYLYNTLEAIRMSAVANDDNEVGDMILSLSHQLKYVLDYGQETVPLAEEKANIDQYFMLMQYRYGEHRLSMDFRFEAELLALPVPKLSIQPLVENAIYHGIMPKAGKGTIRITAELESADKLRITVDDDGVGIPPEQLRRVKSKLSGDTPAETGGSIGLKNVHDRLVTLYGPEYGIEINSTQSIGTSVRMVIPIGREANTHA